MATSQARKFRGYLHADGYAGFGGLYKANPKTGAPAPFTEVACGAHARRKIYDVHVATKSPAATEALEMIAQLLAIEADMRGKSSTERVTARREKAIPILDELRAFLYATLLKISGKSDFAKAIRYATSRWTPFTRCVDDGRLEMSNNAAERAISEIDGRLGSRGPRQGTFQYGVEAHDLRPIWRWKLRATTATANYRALAFTAFTATSAIAALRRRFTPLSNLRRIILASRNPRRPISSTSIRPPSTRRRRQRRIHCRSSG